MTSPGQAFNAQGQGREAAPQVTEKVSASDLSVQLRFWD